MLKVTTAIFAFILVAQGAWAQMNPCGSKAGRCLITPKVSIYNTSGAVVCKKPFGEKDPSKCLDVAPGSGANYATPISGTPLVGMIHWYRLSISNVSNKAQTVKVILKDPVARMDWWVITSSGQVISADADTQLKINSKVSEGQTRRQLKPFETADLGFVFMCGIKGNTQADCSIFAEWSDVGSKSTGQSALTLLSNNYSLSVFNSFMPLTISMLSEPQFIIQIDEDQGAISASMSSASEVYGGHGVINQRSSMPMFLFNGGIPF